MLKSNNPHQPKKLTTTSKNYHITEKGILMDGSGWVTVPECYVYANWYQQAVEILNAYLSTGILSEKIS